MNPVRLLLVAAICSSFACSAEPTSREGPNKKQFNILCRIYRAVSAAPTSVFDQEEVDRIRDDIDVINASFGEHRWFHGIAEVDPHAKPEEISNTQYEEAGDLWPRWKKAVEEVISGPTHVKKLPASSPVVRVARFKLIKIEDRVEEILRDIREKSESAGLGQLNKTLQEAIFGEGSEGKLLPYQYSNRADNCGKISTYRQGTNTAGGKSMAHDFICLCATNKGSVKKPSEGGDNCLGGVASTKEWEQGDRGTGNLETIWKSIKDECSQMVKRPSSSSNLEDALHSFLDEIADKRGIKAPVLYGVLGRLRPTSYRSGAACNGENGSQLLEGGGACVIYKVKNGPNQEPDIPWFDKLKEAIEQLERIKNTTDSIRHDITELKMLRSRAEEIYETAASTADVASLLHAHLTGNFSEMLGPSAPGWLQSLSAVGSPNQKSIFLAWFFLV
ncbi:Variant surface glycoprotein [Trypanosoma congolense IL3000]|uniref:Variant surface glycoprotein n=1 Tax=Trypanosoma congolense (strain IL3000) TaxID=1068625 RepID=F9WHT8_TRYCI|nr:Variant surface glycoprotein [Trypanosoma congolense IL3000]